jgi:hypothetical protein
MADFEGAAEKPRNIVEKMEKHVDALLDHIEALLEMTMPGQIEEKGVLHPFLESATIQKNVAGENAEPSIMSGPTSDEKLTEPDSYCIRVLTKGLLSRFVNQVTQAYWGLYSVRGSHPFGDRIVVVVDLPGSPFDEEVKERLQSILAQWGIAACLDIDIVP